MTNAVAGRVTKGARSSLPTNHGRFDVIGFFDLATGDEHLVLVSALGLGNSDTPALVRVQSECLTGDVFGSQRCDCGAQLQQALALIAAQPGALIYLRGHEGRGVGLLAKLEATGSRTRASTPSMHNSSWATGRQPRVRRSYSHPRRHGREPCPTAHQQTRRRPRPYGRSASTWWLSNRCTPEQAIEC